MMVYYHMILFSNFNTNLEMRFIFGYSFLFNLALIMFINILIVTAETVIEVRRKKRIKSMKDAYLIRTTEDEELDEDVKAINLVY